MQELLNNPAIVAPLSGLAGALLVKLLDVFVFGKKLRVDDATAIRGELRKEVADLKKELNDVYAAMGGWREKYYKEVETNNVLRAENNDLKGEVKEMKEDLELVKKTASELEQKVKMKKNA